MNDRYRKRCNLSWLRETIKELKVHVNGTLYESMVVKAIASNSERGFHLALQEEEEEER